MGSEFSRKMTEPPPIPATAIILAGGKGRRMGQEKCRLKLGGKLLIEHVLERVTPIFEQTVISGLMESIPTGLNYDIIPDEFSAAGPLGGLYSVMECHPSDLYFLCGCDMPFILPGLVRHLASLCTEHDAVVPVHRGQTHAVHAFYRNTCRDPAKELIEAERYKMEDLLDSFNTRFVTEHELTHFDAARSLFNVNTPDDLEKAEIILADSTR